MKISTHWCCWDFDVALRLGLSQPLRLVDQHQETRNLLLYRMHSSMTLSASRQSNSAGLGIVTLQSSITGYPLHQGATKSIPRRVIPYSSGAGKVPVRAREASHFV
jgi:hypothetical protein